MSVIREGDALNKVLRGLVAFDPSGLHEKKKAQCYRKAGEETGWVEVEVETRRSQNKVY